MSKDQVLAVLGRPDGFAQNGAIGSQRTLMWCRVREKVPVFKQQRRHMVGLKPDGFLMNYGSWQGPLQ
jgi:hypothetical protein